MRRWPDGPGWCVRGRTACHVPQSADDDARRPADRPDGHAARDPRRPRRRHAARSTWADGHETTYYDLTALRWLCPCAYCRGEAGMPGWLDSAPTLTAEQTRLDGPPPRRQLRGLAALGRRPQHRLLHLRPAPPPLPVRGLLRPRQHARSARTPGTDLRRGRTRLIGPCYPRPPVEPDSQERLRPRWPPSTPEPARRTVSGRGVRAPGRPARRGPTGPSRTSTASCPGWSSTRASCTRPATSAIRSWSGPSSWPSSPATSTSSSRSGSPACASRSRPARSPARPTAGPRRSSSPPRATRVLELVGEQSAIFRDLRARARRPRASRSSTTRPSRSTTTRCASASSTRSSRS